MSTTPERQLIGSLLQDPEEGWRVIDKAKIKPESLRENFTRAALAQLFEMREAGEPINAQVLSNRLGITSPLGLEVWQLTSEIATAANANYWAKQVIDQRKREELAALALEIHKHTQDPTADLDKVSDQAAAALNQIQDKGLVNRAETLSQAAARIVANLDRPPRYIPTPWGALNEVLGGLRPGALYIIGARPGVGKSLLGLELAQAIATPARQVAFYSFEMTAEELATRALAAKTGISLGKIDRRNLSTAERADLERAAGELSLVHLISTPSRQVSQLRPAIRALIAETEGNLAAVFIDYLQLMEAPGSSLYEKVTAISKELKSLAIELDLPIVTLAQLNREAEKRGGEPMLSDLRDSGSVEQDADAVLLLSEDRDHEDRLTLTIAKNRQGQLAKLSARVNRPLMTISEMVKL